MNTAASPSDRAVIVDILLATYNGADHLAEQIESLFAQDYPHWRVLARDDGSSDHTAGILRLYADRDPERFILIDQGGGNLGFVGNFATLMQHSTADYLAFCDQDDVWLPQKLTVSLDKMRELEGAHGADKPLLVHTDVRVVDSHLGEIAPSIWSYQGTDPVAGDKLNRLLIRNVVVGCAALFNRPLKDLALPIPTEAKAHDWWLAMAAAAMGALGHVSEPTVLYRQHTGNAIGAVPQGRQNVLANARAFLTGFDGFQSRLLQSFVQAEAFRARYGSALSAADRSLLDDASGIPRSTAWRRLHCLAKWRMTPPGPVNFLAIAALALRMNGSSIAQPRRSGA